MDNSLDWEVLQSTWSGVDWTRAAGSAVVKSTGSHCGGQATSRFAAEGRAFERRWPIAAGPPRISQYALVVSQALETVESASRATSVSVNLGLLLLMVKDGKLSRVARVAMPEGSRMRDAMVHVE